MTIIDYWKVVIRNLAVCFSLKKIVNEKYFKINGKYFLINKKIWFDF
jgi:hypothetical protein